MAVIKSIVVKVIVGITIINFVEEKKKENLDMINMGSNKNASKNILKEGLKNISAGTVEYTGGEEK